MNTTSIQRRVDATTARWAPMAIVVLAAVLWLSSTDWKTPTDFGDTATGCSGLCRFVQAGIDDPVVPGGSDWVLEEVVQPNFELFGWLVLASETALAALLVSRRYLRSAAVLGIAQSLAIGLTVANAPDEWYWAYLLMIGVHVAVLAFAPGLRPLSARTMAVVLGAYGAAVAFVHSTAGFGGDDNTDWLVGGGGRDIPDELVRGTFPGSIALGLLLVAVAAAAWWCTGALSASARRTAGWATVGCAVVLLLTYRADDGVLDLALGLGSRASTAAMLAALGLSLTGPSRAPTAS